MAASASKHDDTTQQQGALRTAQDAVVALPLGVMALALGAGPIALGALMAAAAWTKFGVSALDALVASAVVGVVSLAAVGALKALGPRPAATTAATVMFVSCSRLLLATVFALGLYLLREPNATPYWVGFLAAALTSLTAEALIAAGALRAATTDQTTNDQNDPVTEDNA